MVLGSPDNQEISSAIVALEPWAWGQAQGQTQGGVTTGNVDTVRRYPGKMPVSRRCVLALWIPDPGFWILDLDPGPGRESIDIDIDIDTGLLSLRPGSLDAAGTVAAIFANLLAGQCLRPQRLARGLDMSRILATLHPVVSTRCTLCGCRIRPPCASPTDLPHASPRSAARELRTTPPDRG